MELTKGQQGLGITIAGYVCEKGSGSGKCRFAIYFILSHSNFVSVSAYNIILLVADEISGIFVKSITTGSAAQIDGRIQVNDQIIEASYHV